MEGRARGVVEQWSEVGAEAMRREWRGSGGGGCGLREGWRAYGARMEEGTVRCERSRTSPAPCLSACLHVLRWRPGAEAFWQPSLGAWGPGKAGLVPGLRQT